MFVCVSVCVCVCVCVPKDLANRWTDRVLLYNVASHWTWVVLFYNLEESTTNLQSEIAKKDQHTYNLRTHFHV